MIHTLQITNQKQTERRWGR